MMNMSGDYRNSFEAIAEFSRRLQGGGGGRRRDDREDRDQRLAIDNKKSEVSIIVTQD